ncbi:hypothetical protein CJ030_MR5G010056 [Morella rubra]|uniref:Uncharacterized protein n=1 Tax=Morella rubra TaxID=262757 RepID=A0A6A1VJ17_9ROSI|nr:hypothetical protein CJ030_MR5G010056 [Morella rubra]
MDEIMMQLAKQMESVLQPTHSMVSDISGRLIALEQKVTDMDVGWKKEVASERRGNQYGALSPDSAGRVMRSTFVVVTFLSKPVIMTDDVMPAEGNVFGAIHQFELRVVPRRPESDMFEVVRVGLPYSRLAPRKADSYRTHKNRMFQHYSVFNSKEEALEHPYPEMNKEEWTRVCDLFASEEFQRRSAINKENRAKLKIVHTSGARSFQRARALLKNPESDEISAALLYKKTHTNKDGMWTSEDARENFVSCNIRFNDAFVKKWKRYSCSTSQRESHIFAEVLGTKAGYVRGLGCSVRSVGSSSSVSSVDLSRKLEEARLQIEEMRARQLEYEALLVKRSDMEQTMREHLQMMEEQQEEREELMR